MLPPAIRAGASSTFSTSSKLWTSILPGFWLLNLLLDAPVAGVGNPVFFTATAMIGMIALAGIIVRNSILLVDFINLKTAEGVPFDEESLLRLLRLARIGCKEVFAAQLKAAGR